jgi:hypothetical protein
MMRKIGFFLTGVLFVACSGVPVPVPTESPVQTAVLTPAPVLTPILAGMVLPVPEPPGAPVIHLVQAPVEPAEPAELSEPAAFNTGDAGPAGGLVFYPVVRTSTVPPAATQDYKVGDTGPAGGIIIYVKPNADGEWKYLEAAPDSTDVIARWSISQTIPTEAINGSRAIGTGKPNTEYIMQQAMELGGGFGWAAQLCDELEVNGFDDWFLPSRDELNVMWGVLHRRGLGGFQNAWYWSSTPYNDNGTYIWFINFSSGEHGYDDYYEQFRVRAIRQF